MKKRLFYGWWIVVATSLIHFWGAGIFVYSFTAFFNPLVQQFHWSYATTALATSFRGLESGIAAPAVGFLTDRFGPRRLILVGAIWAGIGCMLLSRINSLWSFYALFFFLSIGVSMMFPIPGWTAVTNWFSRRRGTAMGILVAAIGVSGILIPLVSWLIDQHGWRATFIIVGLGMIVIGVPLSFTVRHNPEQYGYLPDGEIRPQKETDSGFKQNQPHNVDTRSFTVREALKTPAFWILTLTATVSSAALQAVVVHDMPALISIQIPREVASSIAASLVVVSVAGRMGFGYLGDRFNKKYLLATALFLQACGLLVFAYTTSVGLAIVFLALFGPGFGGVITLRLAIQGDYFGRKAFGAIQGVMQGIHMVGTIISPVFAGWIYDIRSSYQLAWLTLAITVFISVPLVLMLKSPRERVTVDRQR